MCDQSAGNLLQFDAAYQTAGNLLQFDIAYQIADTI
jgi:hypothetical protein